MRVQQPTMGIRRTLYGQTTLTGADHPQASASRNEASFRFHGVGGSQGAGYKRGYLPPLEESIHGAMSTNEAKRLKELEKENTRLKKLLAEKELDIDILKEVSRGNF